MLERAGFTGHYVLYDQPAFSHELLRCLGVPDGRILIVADEPTVFSAAVFMTPLNVVTAREYPGVFFALRRDLLRAATPSDRSAAPRKIWLQRNAQTNNGRPLVNAGEVYEIVARHGFDVVDMGDLPIRRQIALANGAEVIAGPHGAGFVHAMFMEPGSTVVECFSPEFINAGNFCPEICSLLDHRWFMLVHSNARGAYPYGDELKIDPFQLELLLRSIRAK